jgi:hypothetical protein
LVIGTRLVLCIPWVAQNKQVGYQKIGVITLERMNSKTEQLKALNQLLETGALNYHQREIIERLIFATEHGAEQAMADYLSTMDRAAAFWAMNSQDFLALL